MEPEDDINDYIVKIRNNFTKLYENESLDKDIKFFHVQKIIDKGTLFGYSFIYNFYKKNFYQDIIFNVNIVSEDFSEYTAKYFGINIQQIVKKFSIETDLYDDGSETDFDFFSIDSKTKAKSLISKKIQGNNLEKLLNKKEQGEYYVVKNSKRTSKVKVVYHFYPIQSEPLDLIFKKISEAETINFQESVEYLVSDIELNYFSSEEQIFEIKEDAKVKFVTGNNTNFRGIYKKVVEKQSKSFNNFFESQILPVIYKNFNNTMNIKAVISKDQLKAEITKKIRNQLSYLNYSLGMFEHLISDKLKIILDYEIPISSEDLGRSYYIQVKKLVEAATDEYYDDTYQFYQNYLEEIKDYYQTELKEIKKFVGSIILVTDGKKKEVVEKFLFFFQRLKKKSENFLIDLSKLNSQYIYTIKNIINDLGINSRKFNSFLLELIETIDVTYRIDNLLSSNENELNDLATKFGVSTILGTVVGASVFGLSRLGVAIGTDAAAGAIGGPIGALVGAVVGTVTFIGQAAYYYMERKSKMKQMVADLTNASEMTKELLKTKVMEAYDESQEKIQYEIPKICKFIDIVSIRAIKMIIMKNK